MSECRISISHDFVDHDISYLMIWHLRLVASPGTVKSEAAPSKVTWGVAIKIFNGSSIDLVMLKIEEWWPKYCESKKNMVDMMNFFYYNCSAYGNNCVPILLWWVFAYHAFWNSSYEFLRACCFSPSHKKDLLVGPVMILEMNNQSIRAPLTLGDIIISTVADDNDDNGKMLWRQKRSVFLWHDVNVFLPSPIACSSQCGSCAIGHHLSAWIVKIKNSMNEYHHCDRQHRRHWHRTCVKPESWCVQFRGWGEDRDAQSRVQRQRNDHPADYQMLCTCILISCLQICCFHCTCPHLVWSWSAKLQSPHEMPVVQNVFKSSAYIFCEADVFKTFGSFVIWAKLWRWSGREGELGGQCSL